MRHLFLILILVAILSGSPAFGVIYEEDFSTDPGFTICNGYLPSPEEVFEWDATNGEYDLRLEETYEPTPKFACSPTFDMVADVDFHVSVEFVMTESSYGFPLAIRLTDGSHPTTGGITIAYRGSHNPYVTLSDGAENVYWPTTTFPLNAWHQVGIDYHAASHTADLRIVEVETGAVYAEWIDVPFEPEGFSAVVLGNQTGNGDGDYAALSCDNILIEGPSTPTHARSWGSVRSLFLQ